MPTSVKVKPETWRDWLPPGETEPPLDELITRDELLDLAREIGQPTNVNSLRYWERLGVFPRAVTKGRGEVARVLYPRWVVWLIPTITWARQNGKSWEELGEHLRDTVILAILTERDQPRRQQLAEYNDAQMIAWHALRKAVIFSAQVMRQGITAVEVVYLDANGEEQRRSHFDVPPIDG